MRLDAHEQRASQFEHAITLLGDPAADPDLAPTLIDNYWSAAFHWVAHGCQRQHGQHKENHTQLARYLRDHGEPEIADHWDLLEHTRQGAMYADATGLADVQQAHDQWEAIRTWALTP